MKYTVLIALLGMVSAKHHHHQSLAQKVDVPLPYGSSDVTFIPGKAAAAKVVEKQIAMQAASDAAVAAANAKATQECHDLKAKVTKARVHQIDNEVPQNPYWTRREWVNRPPPALLQVEDNESDKSYQAARVVAANTVAKQEATEASNVATITGIIDKATAETAAKNLRTEHLHIERMNEFQAVFIPEENVTLQMY